MSCLPSLVGEYAILLDECDALVAAGRGYTDEHEDLAIRLDGLFQRMSRAEREAVYAHIRQRAQRQEG